MNNLKEKIQYKKNIKAYLNILNLILNENIEESNLNSLDDTNKIREKSKNSNVQLVLSKKCRISSNDELASVIRNLMGDEIMFYIWLEQSNYCGLVKPCTISKINLLNLCLLEIDIISFISVDFKQKVLLDFDFSKDLVELELYRI